MKQFVYLISSLLLIGCANSSNKMMEINKTAADEIYVEEKASFDILEDAYAVLISEKLQDHLDKQILAEQHPEFKAHEKDTKLFNLKNIKEIEQIKFIGQPEILSDSITKIITQVHFGNTKTDTIISYIKTSFTMIDGVKFKTSKAAFERVKSLKKID
ncbi:hypothetical protein [uncultured Aquimarina sp.]|uniref:hypothetical protein n=1 Tax=uncultured Aquimarina sp. TaxID=575652 RepID=UPI0026195ACA|nr:hypothetical protein [uncultured Aquimarina sp.]